MDRRDFIKKSVTSAIAAGMFSSLGRFSDLYANQLPPNNIFDMVAVKGGEPDVMLDQALKALGGIGKFVKKGQKVVIKPNIGWDVPPENGGNTNPLLVKRLIEHCFNAGAKDVYVFDHTCDNWTRCYSNSGIERAVKDAGGKIVSGATENYYQKVDIKSGKKLKSAKVHELILDSDVFINVPILKNHQAAQVTVSMKNLMGIVWDRGEWHRTDLHQSIADFATFRKPDLNIVDAYYVMKRNGPRGVSKEDVINAKQLLISQDMVAIDAAAAKIYGADPNNIGHIKIASDMKVGTMYLQSLNIKRIIL